MKVLVCGGRKFTNRALLFVELDALPITAVCEGGASGADNLAREWAQERRIPHKCFGADWTLHGKAAGPIRNARMLAEFRPDLVVACPGGAGTADMVRRAREANVKVLEVGTDPNQVEY